MFGLKLPPTLIGLVKSYGFKHYNIYLTDNYHFLLPKMFIKLDENEIAKAPIDFLYLYNDVISPDFERQLLYLREFLNTTIQNIDDLDFS